jgi:lipoate-protein ligase A
MKIRFIDTGFGSPSMNMAIDEALLASKQPVLRFYQWNPAGLSIGYFQSVKCFNRANLKRQRVELVRRITGGNAVLHDKELTYSFIIGEKEMPRSVIESYKVISDGLLIGLQNLGIKAVMNDSVETGLKSEVCFNDPSWYEIVSSGKKIVGSAQKRINGKVLQHGAILMDIDIRKYCSLFSNCDDELIKRVKGRITTVEQQTRRKISVGKIKGSIKRGFQKALNAKFEKSSLSKDEHKAAIDLERNKYSSNKWNYLR